MTTYTETCSRTIDESPVRVVNLKQLITDWFRIHQLKTQMKQERIQLSQMSYTQLRDMGIDRIDADIEANRSDIPASRLHQLCIGV